MTYKQIEKTEWAKRFKRDCFTSYEQAVKMILDENFFVTIYKTDETGEMIWCISANDCDFWMDAFKTKKQAVELCKTMGWKIHK